MKRSFSLAKPQVRESKSEARRSSWLPTVPRLAQLSSPAARLLQQRVEWLGGVLAALEVRKASLVTPLCLRRPERLRGRPCRAVYADASDIRGRQR